MLVRSVTIVLEAGSTVASPGMTVFHGLASSKGRHATDAPLSEPPSETASGAPVSRPCAVAASCATLVSMCPLSAVPVLSVPSAPLPPHAMTPAARTMHVGHRPIAFIGGLSVLGDKA